MQNVEFTSPSAVILSLSSVDDMEVDVADTCVLKKQLKRPFFDGLSYEELRASLSLPPTESVFKKITKKVYSPPSNAHKSISFRVSEDHSGVLTSENIHQWEDTFHMCQEDFDIGGDLRNGWEGVGLFTQED
jgi:hypothetical protein